MGLEPLRTHGERVGRRKNQPNPAVPLTGGVAMLNATDRCDECRAQAYVEVTIYGTAMLYCAHHWRHHEDKLVVVATRIRDFTFLLEPAPRVEA